jgi:RNA polymerase sigma-70 factor (ECF subfamily)
MTEGSRVDALPWQRYREYLHLLVRIQFPRQLAAKLDASDLVQQTLLEAHQAQGQWAGRSDPERAAFLRPAHPRPQPG